MMMTRTAGDQRLKVDMLYPPTVWYDISLSTSSAYYRKIPPFLEGFAMVGRDGIEPSTTEV